MKIFNKISVVVLSGVFILNLVGPIEAATQVNLGTAHSFAVLAGTAITNTGPSVIDGDLGLSPDTGAGITGLLSTQVTGTIYDVDNTGPAGTVMNPALLTTAKSDLVDAYDDAAGQGPTIPIVADLGGETLEAGVYNTAISIGVTGTLTLDGEGDPNAVFIFQAGSTLITATDSEILLINDAQPCNVFWQVGSSATLGTNSDFVGTIMALTSATLDTGADVDGRVLARNGAVTLEDNNITFTPCIETAGSGSQGGSGSSAAASITPTPTPVPTVIPTAVPTLTLTPTPVITITTLVETLGAVKQSIPWNIVILAFAGISSGSILFSSMRKKRIVNKNI